MWYHTEYGANDERGRQQLAAPITKVSVVARDLLTNNLVLVSPS